MKKGGLYYIEWLDHWSQSRWTSIDEMKEEGGSNIVQHIGWYVDEDKHGYFFSSQIAPGFVRGYGNTMYVLKGTIKKKKRIYV